MGNESSSDSSNESSNNSSDNSSCSNDNISPGPDHCQSYNTHFANAETLSSNDSESAFGFVVDNFHAAYEHGNHGPDCKDRD